MSRNDNLRASDADRDHIVDRLNKAATEGRIAADELEQRVSVALKARTYKELSDTVSDLPGPRPRREVQRSRTPSMWVLSTVRANPIILLFALPVLAVTFAMLLAATVIWSVLMVVVMVLGGRPGVPHGPWMYTRGRRGYGPPRRVGRSYWA